MPKVSLQREGETENWIDRELTNAQRPPCQRRRSGDIRTDRKGKARDDGFGCHPGGFGQDDHRRERESGEQVRLLPDLNVALGGELSSAYARPLDGIIHFCWSNRGKKGGGKGYTYQMMPHLGEANSFGTAARMASTACPNCAGRALISTISLMTYLYGVSAKRRRKRRKRGGF